MAVGRWSLVSVAKLQDTSFSRRDALDDLIRGVSRIDFRIAWIGWIAGIIIWAIRAVTETAFRFVMLAERALSREMEFNADLVAVSVTGSDHLINGLRFRIGAAERRVESHDGASWTWSFAKKKMIRDMYSVQSRIVEKMRILLADPEWGASPLVPKENPEAHRLFEEEAAQPHGMWMTHPPHREREENAKRTYIPAKSESTPAWLLFKRADHWRREMTKLLYKTAKRPDSCEQSEEETLQDLEAQFSREALAPEHLGIYHDRLLFRPFASVDQIFDKDAFAYHTLDASRPEDLVDTLNRWRISEEELARLKAVKPSVNLIPGGGLRHRASSSAPETFPTSSPLQRRKRKRSVIKSPPTTACVAPFTSAQRNKWGSVGPTGSSLSSD